MTLDNFVAKFAEQFDELPAEGINAQTRFKELEEWGSMMALVVIAMVDSEYNQKLTGDDIRAAETVEDLYQKVAAKA